MNVTFPALPGSDADTDYDALLRANAMRVFSEPDRARRDAALAELWAENGALVEPGRVVTGWDAISDAVGQLLDMLPPGTRFAPSDAAVGHHGIARLDWGTQDADGMPGPITGTDVALIESGRIVRLYVMLDPSD